jgi:hypothetical protein
MNTLEKALNAINVKAEMLPIFKCIHLKYLFSSNHAVGNVMSVAPIRKVWDF